MKIVSPTELRANIYRLLDEILATGNPLEIVKSGRRLRVVPVESVDKFDNLVRRSDVIIGDPDDLVGIEWADEVNLDLP